jgi:hypothetical protein
MKKILALLMTLALVISAAAVPALAEETTEAVDQVSSATTQNTQGSRNGHGRQQMPGQNNQTPSNRQMPNQNGQMPGNGQTPGQNGQMPVQNNQMPNQNRQRPGRNSQVPQLPDQNSQNDQGTQDSQDSQQSQIPGKGGRNMKHGNNAGAAGIRLGKLGKYLDFDQMLKDGVITQEVYDAIMNYMKEHAPQQADTAASADSAVPAEGTQPPALPDGAAPAEGAQPPALPEGAAPADGAQGEPEAMEEQLLKELLEGGVITQEQYDLLLSKISAAETASET